MPLVTVNIYVVNLSWYDFCQSHQTICFESNQALIKVGNRSPLSVLQKRRSSRNTNKRKKYTVDYDFNITDDSSSSDDDKDKVKKPKEKKLKVERTQVISKESEDGENNLEIDVETIEPTEQAKFFVVSW